MTLPLVIDGTCLTAEEYVALQYQLWRERPHTRLAGALLLLWLALVAYFVGRDYSLNLEILPSYYP